MRDLEKFREFAALDDLADRLETRVRLPKLRRVQLLKAAVMLQRAWKARCPEMLFNMWARAAADSKNTETDTCKKEGAES